MFWRRPRWTWTAIGRRGRATESQKQLLDDQEKIVLQDQGTVKNDQGTVNYDQVQLSYCHITAPIAGRVGLRLVDPGNVVQADGTTVLVVITQVQPITVIFTIAEDSLAQVQARMRHTCIRCPSRHGIAHRPPRSRLASCTQHRQSD
jgi:multidrug efflux pump subunit AcrA (membrane-fusion protein)